MLYLLSAWCFDLFVPLWHDIHTASAFVSPIQGRPCELHLLLLCQTVTRAHGQPGFTQHPRRKTQHAKRCLVVGSKQCFICLFDTEWKRALQEGRNGECSGLMMALLTLSFLLNCIWNNFLSLATQKLRRILSTFVLGWQKEAYFMCLYESIYWASNYMFYQYKFTVGWLVTGLHFSLFSPFIFVFISTSCFLFCLKSSYHCLDWPYLL